MNRRTIITYFMNFNKTSAKTHEANKLKSFENLKTLPI